MEREAAQFTVQEAGCLVYVADRSLLEGTAGEGPVTGGELYQDDGYCVRVVRGELEAAERENWTSRLAATVQLPSGQLIVSGILDPDYDRWLGRFGSSQLVATTGAISTSAEHELGCVLPLEPGDYRVEIYAYPPNDLAGGWMAIEDPSMAALAGGDAAQVAGEHPEESAQDYFARTRPGEPVPEWVAEGYEDAEFLDFVICLQRTGDADPVAALAAGQQLLDWEFRRPKLCPVGIRV